MSNQPSNPSPHDEALAGDPSVSGEASEKVMMRVEGQNEVIKTPPPEIEQEHAETARKLQDSTLEIEDGA